MPITPRARQDRLQEAPIQGPRQSVPAPLEAFGGGREAARRDQAIQGIASDQERLAQEEVRKADQIAVTEAGAKLMAEQTRLLYDKDTGALHRRGSNAFGAPAEVAEAWKKKVDEIEGKLVGDAQKMAFRRMALDRQGDTDRRLQQHVAVEKQRHDDDTTKAFVSQASNAAIEGSDDPVEVTKNLTLQDAALRDYAARAGMSKEATIGLISETNSRTVKDVIFRQLEKGQSSRAKDYLEMGARDFLKGKDLTAVEEAVGKWGAIGSAKKLVDGFMGKADSLKGLMEMARGIDNEATRDEAEKYAKIRWHEKQLEDKEATEKAYTGALGKIDTDNDPTKTFEDVLGPTVLGLVRDPKDRAELERAFRIKRGLEAARTDNEVFYALKTEGANEDTRKEFLSRNLLRYRHKLTSQDFQELSNFQTGLIRSDSKARSEADGWLSKEQVINGVAGTLQDKDERLKFKMAMDAEIRIWQRNNDTSEMPAKDEIQKVMKDFVKENWRGKMAFSPPSNEDTMNAIERTQQAFQAIAQSDPDEVQKIIDALGRARIPVTDEKVLEMYEKGKAVKGGR